MGYYGKMTPEAVHELISALGQSNVVTNDRDVLENYSDRKSVV